jgi:predicted Zn finger-like uncharacterized protein
LRIRCERCATVYELDEKRFPARGALVKCTRCQHVFRAAPPVPDVSPVAPPDDRTEVFGFSSGASPELTASYSSAPAPAPATQGGSGIAPVPPVSHGPQHPRRVAAAQKAAENHRAVWPWIVLALLLVAAALVAVWFSSRKRPDAAALARLVALEELVARDDRTSLELAVSRGATDPSGEARALQALALLWLASDARDDAAPLLARVQALQAMLLREDADRAPGWDLRQDEIASRLDQARQGAAAIQERERRLLDAATVAAAAARPAGATELELLRAQALRQALQEDAALSTTVREASTLDASDPWVEMALGLAAGRLGDPDIRGLRSVATRHPRLLRARVLLARALHAAGQEGEALGILDEVLAENGDHESAKIRKAEILAPPRAAVSRVDLAGNAPPERPAGHLPRLKPRS